MKASKSDSDCQPNHYINSLFMKWLSEWKDDAARKELKTQYTYAKVGYYFRVEHPTNRPYAGFSRNH